MVIKKKNPKSLCKACFYLSNWLEMLIRGEVLGEYKRKVEKETFLLSYSFFILKLCHFPLLCQCNGRKGIAFAICKCIREGAVVTVYVSKWEGWIKMTKNILVRKSWEFLRSFKVVCQRIFIVVPELLHGEFNCGKSVSSLCPKRYLHPFGFYLFLWNYP